MISKITLRDIATFDHDGVTFDNLQKVNIIYGCNGMGKTSLSRVVEHPDRYPECEVLWEHDVEDRVVVYNKDFRQRNLGEHIPGVFTLGEATVEETKAIEELRKVANGEKEEALKKKESINAIKESIAKEQAGLLEWLWHSVYKKNEEFKECLKGWLQKENFKNRILEIYDSDEYRSATIDAIDSLKSRYNLLFGGQTPQKKPTFTTPVGVLQQSTVIAGHPLWKKRIVGSNDVPIAALIEKLGNADWVRQGQKMLDASGDICPFCQKKTIDAKFYKELEAFFDEHYLNDLKTIADLNRQYSRMTSDVLEQLNAIIEQEKREHTGKLDTDLFAANVELLRNALNYNCTQMAGKLKEPGVSLSLKDTREIEATLKGLTDKANDSIRVHNAMVDNIANEREKLRKDVWFYLISQSENEVKRVCGFAADKEKEIHNLTVQGKTAQDKYLKLKEEIGTRETGLTSVWPTVASINSCLKSFGFTGFSIQKSPEYENFYQIQREDGTYVKDTLSEGEVEDI